MDDKILKHTLDDSSKLFKQNMETLNAYHEVAERLEEAEKLLKEWQAFVCEVRQLGVVAGVQMQELDERTDRFLEKEGKNE